MVCKALVLAALASLMALSGSHALTVEEVLALKKAGVSDATIQMLLEREERNSFAAERLGTHVTDDGRVIRSTGRSSRYAGASETNTEVFIYPSPRFRPLPRR